MSFPFDKLFMKRIIKFNKNDSIESLHYIDDNGFLIDRVFRWDINGKLILNRLISKEEKIQSIYQIATNPIDNRNLSYDDFNSLSEHRVFDRMRSQINDILNVRYTPETFTIIENQIRNIIIANFASSNFNMLYPPDDIRIFCDENGTINVSIAVHTDNLTWRIGLN